MNAMMPKVEIFSILIAIGSALCWTQVTCAEDKSTIRLAAERLAATIRKVGFDRIAVLPLTFVEDVRDQQIANASSLEQSDDLPSAQFMLSVSNESRLWAEQMERALGAASEGDFRIVPREELMERLSSAKQNIQKLSPKGDALFELVNPKGDIQGLIVGTEKRAYDQRKSEANGNLFLGAERHDLQWDLIDLADRTIRDAPQGENRLVSLAEEVYRGKSMEYFRYRGEQLQVLLPFQGGKTNELPLKPSDPVELFNKQYSISSNRIHPVFNRSCPFQLEIERDGQPLPITLAVQSSTQRIAGQGLMKVDEVFPHAFVNLEPGDRPTIKVTNLTSKRVMVGVFLDGVNCLGKQRELPDEFCKAWVLEPNRPGIFNSWYLGEPGQEAVKEPFVVTAWEDSVAGQLGLESEATESRSITVVFFTVGWPEKAKLSFFPRDLIQRAVLDRARSRVDVREELAPLGSVGQAPDAFGMGAGRPVPAKLELVKGVSPGTILASMTIWYSPKSDLTRLLRKKVQADKRAGVGDGSKLDFISISTAR